MDAMPRSASPVLVPAPVLAPPPSLQLTPALPAIERSAPFEAEGLPAIAAPPPAPRSWPARAALRFACVYLVFFVLPFPFDPRRWPQWPGLEWMRTWDGWVDAGATWLTTSFGQHVLGMETVARTFSGSGDTTWNYVRAGALATCVALVAALWATLDRGTWLQRHVHAAARLTVRWFLAVTMLGYGLAKVFPLQFGTLTGERLYGTYGDSSGMGILWTFLSASPAYTVFGGAMETLGGLLLFFRRTTALGACVLLAVMANVTLMNFCYDVPVKLHSLHYVAMAAFLLLPDWRRLAAVFVTHRHVPAARLRAPMPKALLVLVLAAKLVVAGWLVWTPFERSRSTWADRNDLTRASPMLGVHEVVSFDAGPPPPAPSPAADPAAPAAPAGAPATAGVESDLLKPWKRFTVSHQRMRRPQDPADPSPASDALVTFADGAKSSCVLVLDEERRTIELAPRSATAAAGDARPAFVFTFERQTAATDPKTLARAKANGMELPPFEDRLALSGTVANRPVRVVLRLRPPESFLIHGRPFRWIQERPFNVSR